MTSVWAWAKTDKYRLMWRSDPATTMVIGWNQVSGTQPVVRYDVVDHGQRAHAYTFAKVPDKVVWAKGMHNHFARLHDLKPNTVYYFIIEDSEGVSPRMYFRTAPASPDVRLSIVAGGDSRNHREVRRQANLLAGKLRPDFILFGGDMTAGNTSSEWQAWLDDWQLVRTTDGYIPPVLVTRGNHEMTNEVLVNLFDLPNPKAYYALTFGGNLLRVYTLNSLIPAGEAQGAWLERDLKAHTDVRWKIAQYHFPIRPHQSKKRPRDDQYKYWAPLFYRYGVRVVMESDAHVVKATWPLKPDRGPHAHEGFSIDKVWGTVYLGEGCWGAPLRINDDDKPWTRASGSFNQFKWIFVDAQRIEIRTVKVESAEAVAEVSPHNRFSAPFGLSLWAPPSGEVIVLEYSPGPPGQPILQPASTQKGHLTNYNRTTTKVPTQTQNGTTLPKVMSNGSGHVQIAFELPQRVSQLEIWIFEKPQQRVMQLPLGPHPPGKYLKTIDLKALPSGEYLLIVRADGHNVRRFRLKH